MLDLLNGYICTLDISISFFYQHMDVKTYNLVGWSDGANSAMILAAQRPDNVRKLVVWGGNSYVTKEEVESYEKIT